MGRFFVLLVAIQIIHNALSFDMWKIIEEKNKEFFKKQKGLSDDNGQRLVGGDIFMTTQDFLENRKVLSAPPQNAPAKQKLSPVFDFHRKYWKRRIPYQIGYEFNSKERQTIEESLKDIEDKSCLKFSSSKSYSDKHWIKFYKGAGCHSGIGRRYFRDSKPTDVSLGNGCVQKSIIIHEVLHSLGFFHEQSRTDRDSYLKIYLYKVDKSWHSNFDKTIEGQENYHGTPYDLRSLMQYGKQTFRKASANGNVMESKDDPDAPISNSEMSDWDIIELNRRYQCQHVDENGVKHVAILSGWSKWVGWTKCMENWRKECSKARYRFCVDSDNCPGANKFGTDEDVVECTPAECRADKEAVDGVWGKWGAFTSCIGTCGWGIQQRTRQCNNPAPHGKGKICTGSSLERKLCRKKRCGTAPDKLDENFDAGFGVWKAKRFVRKSGRASYQLAKDGPSSDHTSQVEGKSSGYYAAAISENGWYKDGRGKKILGELSATTTRTHPQSCLSFHYMLNGQGIFDKNAISVYQKTPTGSYLNSPFIKGGNMGNQWFYASIDLGKLDTGTQIFIEARFTEWRGSVVAVDDIVLDNNKCPKFVDTPKCQDDPKFDCKSKKKFCAFEWRIMIPRCCQTCSDPSLKITAATCLDNPTHASKCKEWTQKGECTNNKNWMQKHCCIACKSAPIAPVVPTCVKDKEVEAGKITTSKCEGWAKKGFCTSAKYKKFMADNCCRSCKDLNIVKAPTKKPTSTCTNVKEDSKCENWAKDGHCEKSEKWMKENCCKTCQTFKGEPACADKDERCDGWASKKESECAKNTWMPKNCCASCKKHCGKDKHDTEKCKKWAKEKFCTKESNKSWMAQNCCFSCMTYGSSGA